jgi:hypothetical protein
MLMTLKRGDSIDYEMTVKNNDGTPTDLTGFNITFSVKKKFSDIDYVIQKTIGNGITVDDPTTGQVVIHIEHGDTNDLKPKEYVYDIQFEISGKYYTPVVDKFIVEPEVTR